jgi:ribosome-associated translation inhibitor RaiA
VSDAIRTPKDCDLINIAFDELATSLRKRADKLKTKKS